MPPAGAYLENCEYVDHGSAKGVKEPVLTDTLSGGYADSSCRQLEPTWRIARMLTAVTSAVWRCAVLGLCDGKNQTRGKEAILTDTRSYGTGSVQPARAASGGQPRRAAGGVQSGDEDVGEDTSLPLLRNFQQECCCPYSADHSSTGNQGRWLRRLMQGRRWILRAAIANSEVEVKAVSHPSIDHRPA